MVSYLILCRSVTDGQRTVRVLARAGIPGQLLRAPRMISGDGCGYCVRLSERWLAGALSALNRAGLGARRVYMERQDHTFAELEP